MHGHDDVVQLIVISKNGASWLHKLHPDNERESTAEYGAAYGKDNIKSSYVLMISGKQPSLPPFGRVVMGFY